MSETIIYRKYKIEHGELVTLSSNAPLRYGHNTPAMAWLDAAEEKEIEINRINNDISNYQERLDALRKDSIEYRERAREEVLIARSNQ